jgi:hypothetical protein
VDRRRHSCGDPLHAVDVNRLPGNARANGPGPRSQRDGPVCCSWHPLFDSILQANSRLLASANDCDLDGMIVDALCGSAQGRLDRIMLEFRGA